MWCETVGCDSPTGSVRSHKHISPAELEAMVVNSFTLVGSPSALNSVASSRAAASSIIVVSAQHDGLAVAAPPDTEMDMAPSSPTD